VLVKLALLKILLHLGGQFGRFWRGEKRLDWDVRLPQLLDLFERTAARGGRLNLTRAEEKSGVALVDITRCFEEGIGMEPMTYLARRRVHHAALLLLTSNLPVAEIVEQTGFRNFTDLDDGMKRMLGRTITAYRADFCK
jgi:transcriptional regulator GlxA family with amidase domain